MTPAKIGVESRELQECLMDQKEELEEKEGSPVGTLANKVIRLTAEELKEVSRVADRALAKTRSSE